MPGLFNMNSTTLSLLYIGLSIIQSYCFSTVTDPKIYKVNPIVQFCFTSFCVALYAFVQFVKENDNSIVKTYKKITSISASMTVQILTWDALADVLNTFPRCCPNLDYSQHSVIAKSDILISLFYAIFVRKTAKLNDYISTALTLIGVGIYFRNILLSNGFTMILLSGITLLITLSKLSLEQAILTEGQVVRMKIVTDSHILFLTNIMASVSFLVLLYALSPFSPMVETIKTDVLQNFYDLYPLFMTTFLVAISAIPSKLLMIRAGLISVAVYNIILLNDSDSAYLYTYLCVGSIAWISLMSVKLMCHAKNFSGIMFSLLSTIIFTYKVTLKAPSLYDPSLIATILFVCLGAFVKSIDK